MSLDPVGVDGIDDVDVGLLANLADNAQRVIEIAVHGDDRRAVHHRLREFALGDGAVRQDHDALDASARGVRRGRTRRVTGAGSDDGFRTTLDSERDRHRHAAIFE